MFHVILYQPEIPPNAGNIVRLCANTHSTLHLIEPLGFQLDEARVRRAGLDYAALTKVRRYLNWEAFLERWPELRLWAFSSHAKQPYQTASFEAGDGLLFGPETRGLPDSVLAGVGQQHCLRIPMAAGSRSINLSNAVAVGVYEAWRQLGFAGLDN